MMTASNQSSHNKPLEATLLLSTGTFLEYFDLMLYVHMAVLINELFFPKTDPFTAGILSAFAFCTTFIFRPFGALFFGWLGDNIGRKATVIITTFMMATSCVIMANLPTYEQIGISAAWIMIICRIVQGMSSMGEIIGAEIYLTETVSIPLRYVVVALMSLAAALGSMAALGAASIFTSFGLNWRLAFWLGAIIAVIGTAARTRLRETPEFADAKRKVKMDLEMASIEPSALEELSIFKRKVNLKTSVALVLIRCAWPVYFYLAYIHCGQLLKDAFGYSNEQVIHQNFILSIVETLGVLPLIYLGYKMRPMLILKVRTAIFLVFTLFCPYLLNNASTPAQILLIQSFIMFFVLDTVPAVPIFYKHFPIFKRFTAAAFLYALSRAIMYVITSFGLIYLLNKFGNWGLYVIMLPTVIAYWLGVRHFDELEQNDTSVNNKV